MRSSSRRLSSSSTTRILAAMESGPCASLLVEGSRILLLLFPWRQKAEHRLDRRDELILLERLGDVAVRPALQPPQYRFACRLRGEHHDRDGLQHRMPPQTVENVESVRVGQVDVEQDRVGKRWLAQRRQDVLRLERRAGREAVHLAVV